MPIVWIAPYGSPTAGSGWVTQAGTGTMIRYITMSTPTATTTCATIPWSSVDFGTTSATTTTYSNLVPYFDDDPQWAANQNYIARSQEQRSIARAAIIRERDEATTQRLQEAQRLQQAATAERQRVVAEVRTRAHALLLEHLTPEQRRTFEQNQWFIVDGKSGVKYRVRGNSFSGNIDVLNKHQMTTHRLCGHCSHDIPLHDQLLAQKFMIEHAEDDFIKIANRHPA